MAELINQDDYIKTALRLPRDLHARVQASAVASGRSMNAEIVTLLERSLSTAPDGMPPRVVLHLSLIGDADLRMRDVHNAVNAIKGLTNESTGLLLSCFMVGQNRQAVGEIPFLPAESGTPVLAQFASNETRALLKHISFNYDPPPNEDPPKPDMAAAQSRRHTD